MYSYGLVRWRADCVMFITYVLLFHTLVRWAVCCALAIVLVQALISVCRGAGVSRPQQLMYALATGMLHIQVTLGCILWWQSPLVGLVLADPMLLLEGGPFLFFSLVHPVVMTSVAVFWTTQRPTSNRSILLAVLGTIIGVLLFVPWPWSPFAPRSL